MFLQPPREGGEGLRLLANSPLIKLGSSPRNCCSPSRYSDCSLVKDHLADYMQKVFRMYGGDESVDVELLCEASIMNAMIDHFGTKVRTKEVDENHFKAIVTVSPSPTFYRWVFGWNGSMKILGPENVKAEYKAMVLKALDE